MLCRVRPYDFQNKCNLCLLHACTMSCNFHARSCLSTDRRNPMPYSTISTDHPQEIWHLFNLRSIVDLLRSHYELKHTDTGHRQSQGFSDIIMLGMIRPCVILGCPLQRLLTKITASLPGLSLMCSSQHQQRTYTSKTVLY